MKAQEKMQKFSFFLGWTTLLSVALAHSPLLTANVDPITVAAVALQASVVTLVAFLCARYTAS